MTNYYVSNSAANGIPAGSANGSGSETSPFLTLEQALSVAGDGDTIYLNNGAYSPASGQYVITAGVDIQSVSPGQATIQASSSAAPIEIATTGGQTVTIGAVNIDAGNTAQNAVLLSSEATTYSLVLSGAHLSNATAYAIGGDGGQTRANVSATDVTYSAGTSLGMVGLATMAAGAIDIHGGQVEISDQTEASASQKSSITDTSASVALIDATTNNVSVNISGVTGSATLDKADTSVVYGIDVYNVTGAVIQGNNITLAGPAQAADIWVQPDPENPLQASGAVIDNNILDNFDSGGGALIVVGENSIRTTGLAGLADNAQIYDNTGSGDAASQAEGLHGILVGFETGAVVSGNVMTSTFMAFGMKDDFGTNLVEDNVDYDSSRYSLYQKGGSGVEWLNNSGYASSGFDPYGLAVGPDVDEPGGVIDYASGSEADGNVIVYSGASGVANYIEAGDTFAAVGAGMSGVDDVGTLVVSWGGVVTSAVVDPGGLEEVLSGGSAAGVLIASGGTLSVSFGGSATAVTVEAGGSILGPVTLSAAAEDFAVFSGVIVDATLTVASGGEVEGEHITSGRSEQIRSGGTESGGVVSSGAELTVSSGGVAVGPSVLAGGSLTVDSGGVLTLSGGTASSGVVSSAHVIGAPTTISGAALSSGAILDLLDETVSSGGRVAVASAAAASGTSVLSGGELIVSGGGDAGGTTVLGVDEMLGADTDAVVSGGGDFIVYAGGHATQTIVLSGGIERVLGNESAAVVSTGGLLAVSSGGVASTTTVMSGGVDKVLASGADNAAVVSSGGALVVYSDGRASGTSVLNGGKAYVLAGGVASGSLLSGGREAISAGGAGVDVTAAGGGILYVLASGTATGTQVSEGGKELVSSGGVARDASVLSGGGNYVYSGGVAGATTVLSGGLEYLYSGGVDNSTMVESGGVEAILSGAAAIDLSLGSGGEVVDDGEVRIAGAATLAGILFGSGAVIETGGGDLVLSSYGDRDFAGGAAIEGGTVELATAGALGSGYVEFVEPSTGSAVLQIDAADAPKAGRTFANVISNFDGANEDIDLTSIAYVAGATATLTGGKLVLSDGGKTYSFTVAGGTAGAYPVLSDGDGGTLIDPKAVAMTHAVAAFTAPSAAGATPISSAETPFLHATGSAGAGHI